MREQGWCRGRLRRMTPLLALAGALMLGGCVDDGYDGYGVYAGGGWYGGPYDDYWGVPGYYGAWPGYGWYDGFYYPGSGYFAYDRAGGRHHWNGPGHGWNGGRGWAGGDQGWHGRGNGHWHGGGHPGGGGRSWHGAPAGATGAAPAPSGRRGGHADRR